MPKSTIHIWVVARPQYEISALVTQISLRRFHYSGGFVKSGHTNLESVVLPAKKNQSFTLTRMSSRKIQTILNPQNLASCQAVIF